jgi:dTDP-4-dehydrorhamnose 3,5-epimerase
MKKFDLINCFIPDLYIVEPKLFYDQRGFFLESYNKSEFNALGLDCCFVQDNHSSSKKGVLRGMHFQINHPQTKLIRVIKGKVFNVVADLRLNSPTYSKWFGIELTEENKKMLYIPIGFANGFLSLSDNTEIIYKVSDYYDPDSERGIIWNDPDLNILWPFDNYKIIMPIINNKDLKHPLLKDTITPFKFNK